MYTSPILMSKWRLIVLLALPLLGQSPDPALGKKIFESQCALCHAQTGTGGRGPSLRRPKLAHAPDDKALWEVISTGIEPEMPGAWQLNDREIHSVAMYVRSLGEIPPEVLPGDPQKGERVYASKGCAGCHMAMGKGEGYGPELSDIGARRSGAHLRQVILQPSKMLPEGFLYVAATTEDGKVIRGLRVNEDSFHIQIKDAQGRFYSFTKSSLKDLRRLDGQTPMPAYQGSLSASELDDLVAYLATLKGKS